MTVLLNEFNQPVGAPLTGWQGCPLPQHCNLQGHYCHLVPLNAASHSEQLYAAWLQAEDDRGWTWLPAGPFPDFASFNQFIIQAAESRDPLHYAVIDNASGEATGSLALMRQDPKNGVIEVGSVIFSPRLQHTTAATEAHALLMQYVFNTLGYRRYEWKCDSLNAPSRRAAERLGFTFEGIFRQAIVYKGRNRDTAWFSLLDSEWPQVHDALSAWLSPGNFDEHGKQRQALSALRACQQKPQEQQA
ncbi:GNAT family N-acetyltransferase [Mangrovibacter plantisponsor]|uniref:RimJ/RimL family protein N-acetyltransferase n=1 Tax=Mangrovibacter plantisponsor TaxID=451513 RepID=A0A317PSK0_9ENTR|nr:GNAT family protein [Mangrovibacter plantisponsor]PWW02999.1 RimJ/RimL family protein N-acetyltransferase [Mangrovibacter plantisponsor]